MDPDPSRSCDAPMLAPAPLSSFTPALERLQA